MSKKIYIAGPMQGYAQFNFPAFFAAEEYVKNTGEFEKIFNPARRDEEVYGTDVSKSPTGDISHAVVSTGFSLRDALGADLEFITKEATDIFMLKGWENSKGARAEHATAVALGLTIHYQGEQEVA